MQSKGTRLKAMLIVFLSITLAIGLCVAFYFYKIQENEKYQNQLHFRELNNITVSLKNGISAFNSFIEQRQYDVKSDPDKLMENNFPETLDDFKTSIKPNEIEIEKEIKEKIKLQKEIEATQQEINPLLSKSTAYKHFKKQNILLEKNQLQFAEYQLSIIKAQDYRANYQQELELSIERLKQLGSNNACRLNTSMCKWLNKRITVYECFVQGNENCKNVDTINSSAKANELLKSDLKEFEDLVKTQLAQTDINYSKQQEYLNRLQSAQDGLRRVINSRQYDTKENIEAVSKAVTFVTPNNTAVVELMNRYKSEYPDSPSKSRYSKRKKSETDQPTLNVIATQLNTILNDMERKLAVEIDATINLVADLDNNFDYLFKIQSNITNQIKDIRILYRKLIELDTEIRDNQRQQVSVRAETTSLSNDLKRNQENELASKGSNLSKKIDILNVDLLIKEKTINEKLASSKNMAWDHLENQESKIQWLIQSFGRLGLKHTPTVGDAQNAADDVRYCISNKKAVLPYSIVECFSDNFKILISSVEAEIKVNYNDALNADPIYDQNSPLRSVQSAGLEKKENIKPGTASKIANGRKWLVPISDWLVGSNPLYPLVLLVDQEGNSIASREDNNINSALVGIEFENVLQLLELDKPTENDSKGLSKKVVSSIDNRISKFLDVRISGVDYRVFVSPFSNKYLTEMTGSSKGKEVLYLIGLREKTEFNATKLTVSRSIVTAVILFILTLIAFIPLLKIRLSSVTQAFSGWDRHTLAIGCVILITVASIGVFDAHHYGEVKDTQNKLSKSLFMQMRNAFKLELNTLNKLAYDNIEDKKTVLTRFKDYLLINDTKLPYFLENLFVLNPKKTLSESAVLDGLAMWGTSKRYRGPTKNISLSKREYAKRALQNNLWPVSIEKNNEYCEEGIFIERLFNLRDGGKSTQFSLSCDKQDSSTYYRALSFGTKLQTFANTVMPENYGFVVFDNKSGKVLYHSEDESRSLVENLYVETDNSDMLKAHMLTPFLHNQPTSFSVNYNGKEHHFTMGVLKQGVPWTLAIFYDKQNSRALNLMSVLVTLTICVIAFVLLYYFIIMIVPKSKRRGVFWPTPHESNKHKNITIVSILLGAIILFGGSSLLIATYVFDHHQLRFQQINNAKLGQRIFDAQTNIQSYRNSVLDRESTTLDEISAVPCYLGTEQPTFVQSNSVQLCKLTPKILALDNIVLAPNSYVTALIEKLWQFSVLDGDIDETLVVTTQLNQNGKKEDKENREYYKEGFINNNLNLHDFERRVEQSSLFNQDSELGAQKIVLLLLLLIAFAAFSLVIFKVTKEWIFERFFGFNIPPFFRLHEKSKFDVQSAMLANFFDTHNYMTVIRPKISTINYLLEVSPSPNNPFYEAFNIAPLRGQKVYHLPTLLRQGIDSETQIKKLISSVSAPHSCTLALQGIEDAAFDEDSRKSALELMEALMTHRHINIILLCEIAPLYRLTQCESYPTKKGINPSACASEMVRWSNVLKPFVKVYDWSPEHKQRLGQDANATSTLLNESIGWPELRSVLKQFLLFNKTTHENTACNEMLSELDEAEKQKVVQVKFSASLLEKAAINGNWLPEQIIEFFSANASALYRSKWEQCTKTERIILFQIASGLEPNPLNRSPLEHLVRRGYICRDKGWFIINNSFAEFVLSAEDAETIESWLVVANESIWQYLRIPFFAIVIALVAIMAYTATDAIETAIGILTAVFGLIPMAIRNFTAIKGGNS